MRGSFGLVATACRVTYHSAYVLLDIIHRNAELVEFLRCGTRPTRQETEVLQYCTFNTVFPSHLLPRCYVMTAVREAGAEAVHET
mmetsp:Transcript_6223/g.6166  ORF Transcript_6223/g.6166 Transcript_6223/m.6166 type:complete len:85 (+) Transcript_6223:226-480(+)